MQIPKRYAILGIVLLCLFLFLAAVWPAKVTLSYGAPTCIAHPHFIPGKQFTGSEQFAAESASELRIGSTPFVAGSTCFKAELPPEEGDYNLTLAVLGIPFVRKGVTIHVPTPPKVNANAFKKPIPVSKQLALHLSGPDTVFSYRLSFDDRTIECRNTRTLLECDIPKLNLNQGKAYQLQLIRYFKGKKVAAVIKEPVKTLSAITLLSSSIKTGETVYTKPRGASAQFDKPVKTANVELLLVDGDKREAIPLKQTINKNEIVIEWQNDLPRQMAYEIVFKHVEAVDGSTLVDPVSIPYKTSGGPTVKRISIGPNKIPLGTTATMTFDQPLSDKQDIGKSIIVTGGAKVVSVQGASAVLTFEGVPRCTDISITVTNELKSNHEVSGGSAWHYASRTICQVVGSIGNSSRGRAITSYTFGSGAETIVYTGAIHGDETSTRALMLRWVDTLEANPRSIPTSKSVIVIPTVNPDGFASGTRTNANNVDLNRNFGTGDWKKDITTVTNRPFPSGGGPAPLSEPETKALANFIGRVRPTLVLSYHSIGGLVAANQVGISGIMAQRYAGLSGYVNSTGAPATFEYAVSGTADDYYAEKYGVASILVELGSHTYHQFERNREAMWAMLR